MSVLKSVSVQVMFEIDSLANFTYNKETRELTALEQL